MEAFGGDVQLLLILDLGIKWGQAVSNIPPAALYPQRKNPLVRRLGGPQTPEEKSTTTSEDQIPAVQFTDTNRLSYPSSQIKRC
jgi:hypothetical protein